MSRLDTWLDELSDATLLADRAEDSLRADFARQVAALAEERAFAYRRVNLAKAIADAVASGEDEETAVAHGLACLKLRLGWTEESKVKSAIVERFAPVCLAFHAACADADVPSPEREGEPPEPGAALAAFEGWYRDAKGTPFWLLFENQLRETPLVDY